MRVDVVDVGWIQERSEQSTDGRSKQSSYGAPMGCLRTAPLADYAATRLIRPTRVRHLRLCCCSALALGAG
jgi:hypothetical protein